MAQAYTTHEIMSEAESGWFRGCFSMSVTCLAMAHRHRQRPGFAAREHCRCGDVTSDVRQQGLEIVGLVAIERIAQGIPGERRHQQVALT